MLDFVERPNTDKYVISDMENLVRYSSLSTETKDSMMGSLQWLKYKSIQQTGRKLVARFLGDGVYAEMSAQRFFIYCYGLRSQILHNGKPEVESIDLSNVTNILQVFVSNLLVTSFVLPVV